MWDEHVVWVELTEEEEGMARMEEGTGDEIPLA
jgi:hypothetical protein